MQDEWIPDKNEIFSWIENIFSQGVRRPGCQADRWAEDFCAEQFRRFGLENVRLEPAQLICWEPRSWLLRVLTESEVFEIPCFPLPYSAATEEIELALVPYDAKSKSAVKGQAALEDVKLMQQVPTAPLTPTHPLKPATIILGLMRRHPIKTAAIVCSVMRQHPLNFGGILHALIRRLPAPMTRLFQKQSGLSAAERVIDSRGTFEGKNQVLPYPERFFWVIEPAMFSGAAAWIGVLTDYPGDGYEYYVPYDTVAREIPAVWIRGSDGSRLRKMLEAGPVRVRLRVDSVRQEITSYNVVGELPGADDDWVVIGSHHDAPWASAVEDASGVALVLAQAAYWSKVPAAERPHRLVFLLNAGHMAGSAGLNAFIKAHKNELKRIALEVHLEHAARELIEKDGNLIPTGEPETRWFYTSQIPKLERAVAKALRAENLDRSLILPPDVFAPNPLTDASSFFAHGVPLVNFETMPFYLFDPRDTLDKVDQAGLLPLTRAMIRIIESTAGVSAAQMRSGAS